MTDNAALPALTIRVLPPEEWDRIRDFGPFAAAGGLPPADHAVILVLETSDGQLAGCWMARDIVMLEGLHLAPEYRDNPTAARKLFFGMVDHMREAGVNQMITMAQDGSIQALAHKAGFVFIPGSIHLLTLKEL